MSRSLRILHTVAWYDPDDGGGATEVVRQLSERLAARGHDVTIATTYSPRRTISELNGVKIRQFRIWSPLNHSVLGIYGQTTEFLTFLRGGEFDVVMNFAAQTWHVDLTCRVLGELSAKRVLVACGYSGLQGWRRILYRGYFRRLPRYLRQYDVVVYNSSRYIDKYFGDAHGIGHFEIIPNGVGSEALSRVVPGFRSRYGIETPHMILSVGNHFTNKGHAALFDAFQRMNRKDVTLVLVGRASAPWYRSCAAHCRAVGSKSNGRIRVLEDLPTAELLAAYQEADVFALASRVEASPLVIFEAMASATPWVAFEAGNIAELPGGIVVPDIDAMAREMSRVLDDASLRQTLGGEGQTAQRQNYTWDAIVDRYEALYRR